MGCGVRSVDLARPHCGASVLHARGHELPRVCAEVHAVLPQVPPHRQSVGQVLVDNGETVVLGGIYEQTKREDVEKVPFFGDLPYIGRVFRQDSSQNNRSELLIFVTPKIVKESLSQR